MVCCRKFFFALGLLLCCITCAQKPSPSAATSTSNAEAPASLQLSGTTMGVVWHVTVVHAGEGQVKLRSALQAAAEQVDQHMSTYKANSEISRFGLAAAGKAFPVSDDTAFVVREAQRIAALTNGAFDATVMPLVDLWGFGPAPAPSTTLSTKQIAEALAQCGYRKLELTTEQTLRKKIAGLRLDLSAIAKGYGVDAMCSTLHQLGYHNFLVEIGGELRTEGRSPSGKPWRIGIDQPVDMAAPGANLNATIQLQSAAVATSGDYRNFHEVGGKRVSHTIDPRSGYPVDHGLASVSILAPTCLEADALATACMVLGPPAAMDLILSLEGIECYLLVRTGDGFTGQASPGFPTLQAP